MKHRRSILAALALALALVAAGAWGRPAARADPSDWTPAEGPATPVPTSVTKRWVGLEPGADARPVRVEFIGHVDGYDPHEDPTIERDRYDVDRVPSWEPKDWVVRTVELDASNGWRVDLELPTWWARSIDRYDYTGHPWSRYMRYFPITYTVREVPVDGYVSGVTGDIESGFTVTNTATGDASVSVTAVWDDGDDADGIRPASVSWGLLADGAPSGAAAEASAATGWAHTWSGLPIVSGGAAVEYALADVEAPEGYAVSVSGDAASGYTVTYTHAPSAKGGEEPADGKPAGGKPAERPAARPAGKRAASKAARLPQTGDAAALAPAAAALASGAAAIGAALRRRNR